MDASEVITQIASMPCLLAVVKEANFTKGMNFVNYIEDLPDNSVKRKKKHFILITKYVDYNHFENRTGNANVHIISQLGEGA